MDVGIGVQIACWLGQCGSVATTGRPGTRPCRRSSNRSGSLRQTGVGSSLRSLPRIFEIFQSDPDPHAHLPSASGARWWLLRMGLYALREPLDQASDWVYIIDHSIQSGTLKLCLILGIRLSDLPSPSRPLRHSDMRLLALIPTEHSNGQIVLQQFRWARFIAQLGQTKSRLQQTPDAFLMSPGLRPRTTGGQRGHSIILDGLA